MALVLVLRTPQLILKDRYIGTIKPVIDQVFPFTEAVAAFERSMSGRAKGKVIIKVI